LLTYRIYFRHRREGIVGRDDFEAEDDRAALGFGETLCDACSDVCDSFELWQGVRHLGTRKARRSRVWPKSWALSASAMGARLGEFPQVNAWHLNAKTQAAVAEVEVRLLDSKWAVAQSRRLLARLRQQSARE
jgi:hypothetical protein